MHDAEIQRGLAELRRVALGYAVAIVGTPVVIHLLALNYPGIFGG